MTFRAFARSSNANNWVFERHFVITLVLIRSLCSLFRRLFSRLDDIHRFSNLFGCFFYSDFCIRHASFRYSDRCSFVLDLVAFSQFWAWLTLLFSIFFHIFISYLCGMGLRLYNFAFTDECDLVLSRLPKAMADCYTLASIYRVGRIISD